MDQNLTLEGLEGQAKKKVCLLLGTEWETTGIWRFEITSVFARYIYMIIEKELE